MPRSPTPPSLQCPPSVILRHLGWVDFRIRQSVDLSKSNDWICAGAVWAGAWLPRPLHLHCRHHLQHHQRPCPHTQVLCHPESLFEVVLIQGHEAEPDQPDPDGDRSGRPADDARVHPLRRPHVPPQIPGLKVDLLLKDVFYLFLSRTHEEEYSRAWGLFMLFHSNFSIHIHTVSIWYTLQVFRSFLKFAGLVFVLHFNPNQTKLLPACSFVAVFSPLVLTFI